MFKHEIMIKHLKSLHNYAINRCYRADQIAEFLALMINAQEREL